MKIFGWVFAGVAVLLYMLASWSWRVEGVCLTMSALSGLLALIAFMTPSDRVR